MPEEQIRQVLEVMTEARWHTFQTLSKFPIRLPEFGPYPDNVWVGVSLPAGHLMSETGGARALKAYLRHIRKVEAGVRFMSIEPLWFDVAPVFEEWLREEGDLPFEWVIIGAATNGRQVFQPEVTWTGHLLALLDGQRVPVFFKGNMEWPAEGWRDYFPYTSYVA